MQHLYSSAGDSKQLPPPSRKGTITSLSLTTKRALDNCTRTTDLDPSMTNIPPKQLVILPTTRTEMPAQNASATNAIDMDSFIHLFNKSSPALSPSERMFVLVARDSGIDRAIELANKFHWKYRRTLRTLERLRRNKQVCKPITVSPRVRESPKHGQ
jgi:hypothetical protein